MNTTHFLNRVMGNLFKTQTSPALPSNYYLGLSTTAPTVSGSNVTEPATSKGYARVQLTSLSTPSNGVITNTTALSFPESTASWGTITNYVVYDAATNGNLLFYGALSSSRTVETDTILTIKANELSITLSNTAS